MDGFSGADFSGMSMGFDYGDMSLVNVPAPAGDPNAAQGYLRKGSLEDRQAALSKYNFADAKARFQPLEEEMIRYVSDDQGTKDEAIAARKSTGDAFDRSGAGMNINLSRYNTNLTADQKKTYDRMKSVSKSKEMVGADVRARINAGDRKREARGELVSIGRGVHTDGMSNINDVASNEVARNNKNKIAKQQATQTTTSNVMTIAAIAAMVY